MQLRSFSSESEGMPETIPCQTGTIRSQPQIFCLFFREVQKPIRLGINCASNVHYQDSDIFQTQPKK